MRPRTAAFDRLVDTISTERDVVEYLLFKLVTLKLLFIADERRFIDKAAAEVEKIIDGIRGAEQVRDEALQQVAAEWDVPSDELTLRRLLQEVSGDEAKRVRMLQRSFQLLTDEIETLLEDNRALASNGLTSLRSLLDAVASSTGAELYTEKGQRHRVVVRPTQLDRAL